jgi:hypothetical protein
LEQHNLLGPEEETADAVEENGEEDEWQGADIFLGRSELETFYEEVNDF